MMMRVVVKMKNRTKYGAKFVGVIDKEEVLKGLQDTSISYFEFKKGVFLNKSEIVSVTVKENLWG